jgi:hypothetical protein
MEMWMQGLGVYAELLADTVIQAIGERETGEGKEKASGVMLGAFRS